MQSKCTRGSQGGKFIYPIVMVAVCAYHQIRMPIQFSMEWTLSIHFVLGKCNSRICFFNPSSDEYTWYVQPCEFLQAYWWVVPEADCKLYASFVCVREKGRGGEKVVCLLCEWERELPTLQSLFNWLLTWEIDSILSKFPQRIAWNLFVETQIEVLIKSWIDIICNLVEYLEGEEMPDFEGLALAMFYQISIFTFWEFCVVQSCANWLFRFCWYEYMESLGANFILWLPPLYIGQFHSVSSWYWKKKKNWIACACRTTER